MRAISNVRIRARQSAKVQKNMENQCDSAKVQQKAPPEIIRWGENMPLRHDNDNEFSPATLGGRRCFFNLFLQWLQARRW